MPISPTPDVLTWNVGALLHHDSRRARDKEKRLRHLLTRTEITTIQETHGNDAAL